MEDILGEIRRYLIARYREGMDVAYRLGEEAVEGRAPAGAGASIPVSAAEAAPAKAPRPGAAAAPRAIAAPVSNSAAPDEVPVVTSAFPADDIGGRVERLGKNQSIHFTSDRGGASQASLFGEPAKRGAFDLGGCDLGALEKLVSTCQRCELARGRTKTVFGSGNPRSRIVFIGEAPGRDEDLQGLPFVGGRGSSSRRYSRRWDSRGTRCT